MLIFIIVFIICYVIASIDTTKDEIVDKPHITLRDDMEFADLITAYLKGDNL